MCESIFYATAIQTEYLSVLECLWRSLIFEKKKTKRKKEIEAGIDSVQLSHSVIQEPYARKRPINQKPYKEENISRNTSYPSLPRRSQSYSSINGWGKTRLYSD